MKKQILLLVLMLLPIVAKAYDAYVDGINYNFSGDEATVTSNFYNGYNFYSENVIIPESVTYNDKTYIVTKVGDKAFYTATALTSITIPNSVTIIGELAFSGCTSLRSVSIGEGVTSIGDHAFAACDRLISITIPNNVTSIGIEAFYACTSLTSITIGNGVTTIGNQTFLDCSSLTSITIPNTVTSIGQGAFNGCSSLSSITIPESVTSIGNAAFSNCSDLTSVTIPNSVTSIGGEAFLFCSSLISVTIPNSVTSIGDRAFYDCGSLTQMRINKNVPLSIFSNSFGNRTNATLYVPYGSKSAYEAADYWKEFKEIIESEYLDEALVYTIDKGNMTAEIVRLMNNNDKVIIPSSIVCDEETYSVTSIGNNAFQNCSNLVSITIPPTLKRVKTGAFSGCTSLSKVIVTDIAAWCGIIYDGDDNNGDFPLGRARHLYSDENTEITEIVIPEGVTRIEPRAFRDAASVTSLTIPNSVIDIESEAFRGMNSLTSIIIPDGVTTIGNNMFDGCFCLTSITLPVSVVCIGNQAFFNCSSLKNIYCNAENVPNTNSNTFDDSGIGLTTLHVPSSSVEAYQSTAPWSSFGTIVAIGEEDDVENVEIATAEDLATFAARVNAGETSLCATLKADIDFTAYPDVTIDNWYHGEFDGAGHSIKLNLTHWGLFSYLRGYVHDLTTEGTITVSDKFAGGIASQTEKAIIERCQSKMNIVSSTYGDGTHGGIVGVSHIGTIIRDCLVIGDITGSRTRCCGGVSGWADGRTIITNCLVAGNITVGTYDSDLLARNSSNVFSTNNYFQGEWSAPNKCSNVTRLTENQVKSGEACFLLNNGRTDDEMVWYQTLGEDNYPVPDNRHLPVWLIEGTYTNWNMFTITFNANGGSQMESITQTYGTTITPPEDPTREGYTFMGWEPAIPETMPANDLTVVAQWQINSYALVYVVDGEEYRRSEVEYGTGIIPEAEPTKEGYTFSGWSDIPETMPANDVTVTGSFSVSSYTLTYIVDGEVYRTETVAYGTALTPEPALKKTGYMFTGWSEIPTTMPAHDVVVTGNFYIYGDVNIDEEVDLLDVVDIARFVVGTPAETFMVNLADLNYDKTVNVTDAVVLINEIAGDQNFVKEMRMSGTVACYDYASCGLELLGSGDNTLSFCLNGEADFTAFQFTMDVPEDVNISVLRLNGGRKDGHQLMYNRMEDGSYRVVVLSLANNPFIGSEGELLGISLSGQVSDEISIRDIHFVTANGTDVPFEDLCLSGTTTQIERLMSGTDANSKVYDLLGRRRHSLQQGVNIVNGKKVIIK